MQEPRSRQPHDRAFQSTRVLGGELHIIERQAEAQSSDAGKVMSIGRKLRQLNNYNALGAIIAGVNQRQFIAWELRESSFRPTLERLDEA